MGLARALLCNDDAAGIETGLDYFGARYFSGAQGRFTSPDLPLIDQHPEDPQSWNLYSYARNNPLKYTDSTGHCVDSKSWSDLGQCLADSAIGAAKFAYNNTAVPAANLTNAVVDAALAPTGFQFGSVQPLEASNSTQAEVMKIGELSTIVVAAETTALTNTARTAETIGQGNTATQGTEVVQRAMSTAELTATRETGFVRGGREGTHFVSDAVNNSATGARQRLALPNTPEVRATLEVPSGTFSAPSRVQPVGGLRGGGTERTATGPVPVRVIKVKKY